MTPVASSAETRMRSSDTIRLSRGAINAPISAPATLATSTAPKCHVGAVAGWPVPTSGNPATCRTALPWTAQPVPARRCHRPSGRTRAGRSGNRRCRAAVPWPRPRARCPRRAFDFLCLVGRSRRDNCRREPSGQQRGRGRRDRGAHERGFGADELHDEGGRRTDDEADDTRDQRQPRVGAHQLGSSSTTVGTSAAFAMPYALPNTRIRNADGNR